MTFEPLAPLLDGTTGETVVRLSDGTSIADVPLTRYRVSARYLAPASPVDLLVRVRDTGDFGASAEADFEEDWGNVLMQLQFMLP